MAVGDTLLQRAATDGQLPNSGGAYFNTRNDRTVVAFESVVNRSVIFAGIIPQNFAGNDIQVRLALSAANAIGPEDTTFGVEFDELSSDRSDTWGTQVSGTATLPTTAGEIFVGPLTVVNANLDSLAAGDPFRLRITRLAEAGTDNAAGDVELHALELREV